MVHNSGIKIGAMFVVLAAAASANSQGVWDGYALPRAIAQPDVGHVPGSYRAWLDNVRPQQRPRMLRHQIRVAHGGGQDDYASYDDETKYTDTTAEPYTTDEPHPSYETTPYPAHPTDVYKSTEPYVCPPPVEPTTVTVTVTCTVTEPAPPPVTVTSVCTVTETTTVEVEPTHAYYNSYTVATPYTQVEYYTLSTPAYAAPVYTAPVYTAPVYTAPAYTAPVYTAPVYNAPVYTAPVYTAPAYTAPYYTAPAYAAPYYTAPVYTAPVYTAPAYTAPPPAYSTPEPSSTPYSSSPTPYSSSSIPYSSTASSSSSHAPAYTAAAPTYASVSESTSIVTVTQTSVSTATYMSIIDGISEVTVTETSYAAPKKSTKTKKGKKAAHSPLIKQDIPSNPWVRVVPGPVPTGLMAAGDNKELARHGHARNMRESNETIMPEYAGDIGFQLRHENLHRNAVV
ncbi:hypothetical protein GGI20_003678 [Coemansia sp. BCRC 34301]|nr:hypothetical protein GGI20_003678 [Coemansia sp. BCRC 34301]